eukprot:GHVN01081036.1.p1 GENE.GHVN01081036.1~~GHVN01081036.1.p1  ORF type:complete len:243 (+),score=75.05 GHVN01081036.1:642-1370(+)
MEVQSAKRLCTGIGVRPTSEEASWSELLGFVGAEILHDDQDDVTVDSVTASIGGLGFDKWSHGVDDRRFTEHSAATSAASKIGKTDEDDALTNLTSSVGTSIADSEGDAIGEPQIDVANLVGLPTTSLNSDLYNSMFPKWVPPSSEVSSVFHRRRDVMDMIRTTPSDVEPDVILELSATAWCEFYAYFGVDDPRWDPEYLRNAMPVYLDDDKAVGVRNSMHEETKLDELVSGDDGVCGVSGE